ncbi:zinc-finger domain-containing protein [Cryptosporidium ubiquitum]|uniref:Zinc-finger domain-containing protein n=1 Tax=Cryptosporidium ubiquitum TaxID=857276 RepID=A0A1J4MG79_9CRYT|nr:zinc-finger domain-containing protein [Cryptosporidium ubiquitum]OII73023.1 zinc-finger domain-containing protein [Cryptosporidium ubiquitum]
MLIAFSVCLLAAIIFCNFALIFCRRIPCEFEANRNIIRHRNNFSIRISDRNSIVPQIISTEELSKIAPVKKYGSFSNKNKREYNIYSRNNSLSGFISSGSTQKSKNNYSCVICLNNIHDEDLVRKLPCKHVYHFKCIDEWVKIKSNCPLCNINLISIYNQNIREREIVQSINRIQSYEEVEFSEIHNSRNLIPEKLIVPKFTVFINKN